MSDVPERCAEAARSIAECLTNISAWPSRKDLPAEGGGHWIYDDEYTYFVRVMRSRRRAIQPNAEGEQ